MSILTGIFKGKKESKPEKTVPWKTIDVPEQVDAIVNESEMKLIAIFKHSTRCGISRMALTMFGSDFDAELENVSLYILDLLSYPEISAQIAEKFGVPHESPQLILIKNRKMVYTASHHQIAAEALKDFV